jgi:hypothetical protein
LRIAGFGFSPIYDVDNDLKYIPSANQAGAFLDRHRWAFNDRHMGNTVNWSPERHPDLADRQISPPPVPTAAPPIQPPENIIDPDLRKQAPGGRHQIGTVAGFRLECMAGFVGIRIESVWPPTPIRRLSQTVITQVPAQREKTSDGPD